MGIHPLACVDPSAVVGDGAVVGPFAVVGAGVVIGQDAELCAHAVVLGDTLLGSGCRVFPGAVLGAEPQDLKYRGEPTRLRIGARCTFREGCTVHRGTDPAHGGRGETVLGDDVLLMAQSHVAHDAVIGCGCVLANSAAVAGHGRIGDGAVLGGLVGIHQYARVGRLAMVGAGAMVSKDVPPFCIAQGDRARLVGLNTVGLRRAGIPRERIRLLAAGYRVLTDPRLLATERIERLRAMAAEAPELLEVADFAAASRRGLCRRRAGTDLEEET